MNKMSTKKITYCGLMIALSVLLPQVFHFFGFGAGQRFLPMHIPVLISGFIIGPIGGLIVGAIAPLISSLITTMPALDRVYFMMIELAIYGLFTGLLYSKTKNIIISLIGSMIVGRIAYAITLFASSSLFGGSQYAIVKAWEATITGFTGIIIQLVVIPPLIYALKKGGYLNDK